MSKKAVDNSKLTFKKVAIGESFWLTGIQFVKKSSRTAYRFGMPHRFEYFKNDCVCFDNRMASIVYESINKGTFL